MNVFEYICLDVWQIIFKYCDFMSMVGLTRVCKLFNNNLQITDFYNIEIRYKNKLTDDILKNYKNIIKLNAYNNIERIRCWLELWD